MLDTLRQSRFSEIVSIPRVLYTDSSIGLEVWEVLTNLAYGSEKTLSPILHILFQKSWDEHVGLRLR